jgi:hypothetical protein
MMIGRPDLIERLEGIGPDPRIPIDKDREVAVLVGRFDSAERLRHRFHILRDGEELIGRDRGHGSKPAARSPQPASSRTPQARLTRRSAVRGGSGEG